MEEVHLAKSKQLFKYITLFNRDTRHTFPMCIKTLPTYFSMHEEADGEGDIEATL